MKVGFDAKRLFCNFTGLGNYSRTLVGNLQRYFPKEEYHLYTTKSQRNAATLPFLDPSAYHLHQASTVFRSYWRSYGIISELEKNGMDLYHGLSNELPFNIGRSGVKSLVTIHDLIFKVFPGTYPLVDRKIYDLKFRYSCEQADRIIAISNNTKKDIIRFYGIEPDKIEVIYQSCNPVFYQSLPSGLEVTVIQQYDLPAEYFLYVGSVEQRKNLKMLVRSFDHLPADFRLPLVVVGRGKRYLRELKKMIREREMEKKIIFIGDLDDNLHLRAIYQQAALLVYPSLYEGFGLPIVEGLLCRTPVVTARSSSLMEAGGPHTRYVDPRDPEEIAFAIEDVLSNEALRTTMTDKGYEYAIETFSPRKLSAQLMRLYAKTLAIH